MAGKFELYTDAKGKFRFRLKASNGEIIAVGEAYESKTAAMSGIESIRRHAAEAPSPSPKPAPKPAPKANKPAAAPTASASAEHMAHH
jgi:uncharacterized protein YegP (UPF0339 family)